VVKELTLLWLDDIRDLSKPDWKEYIVFSPIEQPFKIEWVKNYWEFVSWITVNGLPDGISFDHDLSDFQAFKNGFPELMEDVPWPDHEKTGLDCVNWLVGYCKENKIALPPFNCHSANAYGKVLMNEQLNKYKDEFNASAIRKDEIRASGSQPKQ
jgi:hypothetical protein